jgi:hypothetical protein
VAFVFTAEDGSTAVVESVGEGQDSSDKAVSKAMTMALKTALGQTFAIATEDDPDGGAQPETRNGAVAADVKQALEDTGTLPPDQQIARRAQEVGADHRALVLAISKGRTASGKDLEAEEVRKALHAANQLERGVWKLVGTDEEGWRFELVGSIR